MKTNEYLGLAVKFERMVTNKINELERYKSLTTSITTDAQSERVQSSGDKDRVGNLVAKIVDLQSEIDNLLFFRSRIIKQMESIDDSDEYQIIYSKYIDGCTMNEISRNINLSRTQVYRKYEQGMRNFERKYGKGYLQATKLTDVSLNEDTMLQNDTQ